MDRRRATRASNPQHGPVANALKWAFKRYILARRALDDAVTEARAEAGCETSGTMPDSIAATAESVACDGMRIRWISADAVEACTIDDLADMLDRRDGFIWIDVLRLDDAAEHVLTDVLKLHPRAVRDCREPGHLPKIHAYGDHLFMVLQGVAREPGQQIQQRELSQFIGAHYLVTVNERLGAAPLDVGHLETSAMLGRVEAGRVHPHTPAELSYAIVTRLSAHMEALVAEVARSVATLNESLRGDHGEVSEAVINEMFELRDALLAVETIAAQNRATCVRLETLATRVGALGPHPLIADILDQFERIRELCRAKRELLQGILDFSRTRATAKMDRAMSRLALLGAVVLPVAVVADLHGMNLLAFQPMPLNVLVMALGALMIFTLGMLRLKPV